jgi:hypothetical protein
MSQVEDRMLDASGVGKSGRVQEARKLFMIRNF